MASITFGGVGLSTYNLTILKLPLAFQVMADSYQLYDKAYASQGKAQAKALEMDAIITGNTAGDLKDNYDAIIAVLNTRDDASLVFDRFLDRYWTARFEQINGNFRNLSWTGTIRFIVYDPMAFDVGEEDTDYPVNADPKTIPEVTGGTALISPVYTLTAGENLVGVTILVENVTRDEELSWVGDLALGEELMIDTEHWLVEKEGVASMATVTGQFPLLNPNVSNSIKITGFSNTGSLNIKYRNRYA